MRSSVTSQAQLAETVYPQFLQPVTDTGWGHLAQRSTFCLEREPDLENVVSFTPVRSPGTLFTILLIPVHSENDSKVYFLIVLTTDYCWRSWTCRIAAPYKYSVDWLIDRLIVGLYLSDLWTTRSAAWASLLWSLNWLMIWSLPDWQWCELEHLRFSNPTIWLIIVSFEFDYIDCLDLSACLGKETLLREINNTSHYTGGWILIFWK